ncbi:MAG: hypothetical protein NTW80_05640 [Deltaproteobacteria bacterium]|nr:hypothetical protein [Deltaproteobacteria bacterium]
MQELSGLELRRLTAGGLSRLVPILFILALPLLLGAWQDFTGNTINPRFVERIQDGKTTRTEILAFFGDPKEVQKTDLGPVYKYFSYKDSAPDELPYQHDKRHIQPQSDQQYLIDDKKQIKKPPLKTEGKILRSTLTVRFKSDGQTVMSHEYKEF